MLESRVNTDSMAESYAEETFFMNNDWRAWKGIKSEFIEPKEKLAIKVIMVNLFKAALFPRFLVIHNRQGRRPLLVSSPWLADTSPADKPTGGHASRRTLLQGDIPPVAKFFRCLQSDNPPAEGLQEDSSPAQRLQADMPPDRHASRRTCLQADMPPGGPSSMRKRIY